MIAVSVFIAALLAFQDVPVQDAGAPAPAERIAALKKEFKEAQKAFSRAYGEAKTPEEREQVIATEMPKPESFAPRAWAIAEEFPKDDAAAEALVWIVQIQGQDAAQVDRALDALLVHHLASERVADACSGLSYSHASRVEPFLQTLLEKSPSEKVRAAACYGLAKVLGSTAQMARTLKETKDAERRHSLEQWLGAEKAKRLAALDEPATAARAEKLLERVVAEFGDQKHAWKGTLGEAAERDLFEIRHLAIGKVAPDIEGEDIGGVAFKLSDYRGKVVVLDFWGHW